MRRPANAAMWFATVGFAAVGFAATGFVTVGFVTVGFATVRFAAGRFVRVGFVAAVGFMIVGFAVLQKLAEDKVSLQQRRDVLKRTMQQLSSEYEALKKQLTENETYVQVDSCTAFLPPPRRLLFSWAFACSFDVSRITAQLIFTKFGGKVARG